MKGEIQETWKVNDSGIFRVISISSLFIDDVLTANRAYMVRRNKILRVVIKGEFEEKQG